MFVLACLRSQSLLACAGASAACLPLLCGASLAGGQEVTPGSHAANAPGRIHLVICGLTNDPKIGGSVAVGLQDLEETLRMGIAAELIASFHVVRGDECTACNILRTMDSLDVKPSDTLFCYYAGHGSYVDRPQPGDLSEGQQFEIPGCNLPRYTLWTAMHGKKARLTVLISDTCNVAAWARRSPTEIRNVPKVRREDRRLEALLLAANGSYDISATKKDEYSWFTETGGWFTNVLCEDLPKYDEWQAFFTALQADTEATFQLKRKEVQEHPCVTYETKWTTYDVYRLRCGRRYCCQTTHSGKRTDCWSDEELRLLLDQQHMTPIDFQHRPEVVPGVKPQP